MSKATEVLDQLLQPSSVATILFLALSFLAALYLEQARELARCKDDAEVLWERLPASQKTQLLRELEDEQYREEAEQEAQAQEYKERF